MIFRKLTTKGLLLSTWMLLTDVAYGEACIATGTDRQQAIQQFNGQCAGRVVDCDRYRDTWYCADQNLTRNSIEQWLKPILSEQSTDIGTNNTAACNDSDGDGWGWNGTNSCRITGTPSSGAVNVNRTSISSLQQNECKDPDGDGWGWNGTTSCRLDTSSNQQQHSLITDDNCQGPYGPQNITDLILVTGQSNVTGAQTAVAGKIDRFGKVVEFYAPDKPHPRVFAWTVDSQNNNNGTGWKVAELTQSWHDSAPGVGGISRNNFAFHFAKKVATESACRVVGFVMVSEGGRGISHWDYNAPGWNGVTRHVTEALNAIGRTSIDGILWHQGESDWIADGTCYTGSVCRNNDPDYYPRKLYSAIADARIPNTVGKNALIDRLRRQSWFGNDTPFIAGETVRAPVNIHLNKLNTDGDKWTACVSGDAASGLEIRDDDPYKNHYSAAGLREIGARYATTYLKMKGH